jgi:exodeoxyribonuclease VII small subunit
MTPRKIQTELPIDKLNYEQAFAELENIVTSLETGEFSLDASLALFERGQALAKHCADLLDKAELTVRQLSGDELSDLNANE